jgi:hypothetical protein
VTYRSDLDALAARHASLAADVEAKTKELDATGRMLDEMKAKARLPVLPNIRIASPCSAEWKAMAPVDNEGERVRHCGQCDKHVYNLSQMTRDEAEALILAKEGKLCARYYQRKDGTILLKDCEVGTANARKRRWIAAGAAALLAGGAGAAYTLRPDHGKLAATIEHEPHEDLRGEIVVAHDEAPPPPLRIIHDPPRNWHPDRDTMPKMGGVRFHDPDDLK